jgi:ribosome biogenesis protein SSF1/2
MFPPLSTQTTSISSIRRVLLCNRTVNPSDDPENESTDSIDIRHYSISTKPVGLPRLVRKTAASSTQLPNLGKLADVADFVLNGNDYDSASEVDEDEKVDIRTLSVKRESETQQRAIKLTEIGPRLQIELVKIEEGMCDGKVLYHRYVHKSKVLQVKCLLTI